MKWISRGFVVGLALAATGCVQPAAHPPFPTSSLSAIPTQAPTVTAHSRPTATLTPTSPPSSLPTFTPATEETPDDDAALWESVPVRPFAWSVVNPEPPRRVPNAVRAFWVTHGADGQRRQVSARLVAQTPHAEMWVEDGIWRDVRQIEEAAWHFETQIYPRLQAVFGSEWTPGVDNNARIVILHAAGLGRSVVGYVSSADEYPRSVYATSNEAEMITVNLDTVAIGTPGYYAVLAVQLQRLIQWAADPNEARWVKEGLAQLAVWVTAAQPGCDPRVYLANPDTSLTNWRDTGSPRERAAACLFALYYHQRFGDAGIRSWAAEPLDGPAGITAALREVEADLSFESLFADWLVANHLDGAAGATPDDPYQYTHLDLPAPTAAITYTGQPISASATVAQFGADYIVLPGQRDLQVTFTGALTASVVDVAAHSGRHYWWSNRADESLTTLARTLDLSAVDQATLTYWVWYDIEAGYDYASVEVSSDGGQTWQALVTPLGTEDNPHGSNPGWGYTGLSTGGREWIQERVDLTPYVGQAVLVRFSYLTDEAVTGVGFLLDDIEVPEIGFYDDMEREDEGWRASGFVRTDGEVSQHYLVLLIGQGDAVTVQRLALDASQQATWTISPATSGWRVAVLVISGMAPGTTQPAAYQMSIDTIVD
ncbi:MAG: hypothetical protein GX601_11930 [Anaerolineales bacterium]|nr:hypothetical protein [Anaerolineales bacterium]